jgi:hypothetical protein
MQKVKKSPIILACCTGIDVEKRMSTKAERETNHVITQQRKACLKTTEATNPKGFLRSSSRILHAQSPTYNADAETAKTERRKLRHIVKYHAQTPVIRGSGAESYTRKIPHPRRKQGTYHWYRRSGRLVHAHSPGG